MKYLLSILLLATSLSAAEINLSWQDNSDNETSFVVERAIEPEPFVEVATVGADVTEFTDNVEPGTYQYRVKARNEFGDSGYSNTLEAKAGDPPNAPSVLVTVTVTATVNVIVQ